MIHERFLGGPLDGMLPALTPSTVKLFRFGENTVCAAQRAASLLHQHILLFITQLSALSACLPALPIVKVPPVVWA